MFFLQILLGFVPAGHSYAQPNVAWYNTDSLLHRLSASKKYKALLKDATLIYTKANIDSTSLSRQAFQIAYLEKKLIDCRQISLKGISNYRKKQLLTIVDFTRPGNKKRMVSIDLLRKKVLHTALVTQGAGNGTNRNDKYALPTFFSNVNGSECSSLGMVVATTGTHPDNPCHLCKYFLTRRHDCVVVLEGLEKGINNNVEARDVVIHTTGSISHNVDSLRKLFKIRFAEYEIKTDSCKCCLTREDGSVKRVSCYATQCGIDDNAGYMGQSNGCLVLPEDDHIDMMSTVKDGSLILIYSNVIAGDTNYFLNSPIIRKMLKQVGVGTKAMHK